MITSDSTNGTGGMGGKAPYGVLFSMCLAVALVTASMAALNLALPDLAVGLSASITSLTWIVDAYVLALAGLVLPLGALGDRVGRRAVLLAGTVVFGAASLAGSYASDTTALIAWRAAIGVGAAMIMPGTLSTITAVLPADDRPKGVALWAACSAAGVILGMLVTGVLLRWFSWRSVFVAGAAGALVAGVAALLLAPETRDTRRSPFDARGAVCTALAPAALVYALIEGNDGGWVRPQVVTALAVTMLAIAAYVVLGLRTEHPLLDPRLFRIAGFGIGTATIAVQFMAVFGFYFVGLQYLQLVLGYSALKSAVALVPVAVVIVLASEATPGLAARLGERTVMIAGLLLLGSGLAAMSLLDTHSGYLPFLGGLVVAGLGIGMTGVVGTSAITSSLSRDQQGVASAMNDITREVGAAVGIALMGSVFGSHYRRALPDVSHLPPAAADAVRHSPVGGLYVADRLGPQGAALGAAVKDAFTKGMSAALIAVTVVIAAAVCFLLPSPNKRKSTALAETTSAE